MRLSYQTLLSLCRAVMTILCLTAVTTCSVLWMVDKNSHNFQFLHAILYFSCQNVLLTIQQFILKQSFDKQCSWPQFTLHACPCELKVKGIVYFRIPFLKRTTLLWTIWIGKFVLLLENCLIQLKLQGWKAIYLFLIYRIIYDL